MLREGRSTTATYNTTFLVQWPAHLGGEATGLGFHGAMVIIPMMGMV